MRHCEDNKADREIGQYWEREFCKLAGRYNFTFTPLQIGRPNSASAYNLQGKKWNHYTLPDIVIWTHPGQHHEIKHKSPTIIGQFGLEKYRFDSLFTFAQETNQDVMYTIHNHALNGGRDNKVNILEHWLTANILELNNAWNFEQSNGTSYVNGQRMINIPIYYWDISLWIPLAEYWNDIKKVRYE